MLLQIKKITAYKVAKDTGISQGLCNEYKNGIKTPTIENLIKIADYLDCSVDYLLGRTDTPNGTYTINNQNTTVSGTQANVINHNVTASENTPDTLTEQFIQVFRELDFKDKVDVMKIVTDKIKK